MYAVFAITYIAKYGTGGFTQGRTIADSYGIPVEYLLKILQQLARAQIIQSERGPRGGFRLRKPPAMITLLEIVEATEGTIGGGLSVPETMAGTEGTKEIIEDLLPGALNIVHFYLAA